MIEESRISERSTSGGVVEGSGEVTFTPIVGSSGMSYRPFMEIGRGGMARVLLAHAKGPSGFTKLVVLKTIRRDALANVEVREMFLAEARLCARLNHPNLVQVYEVNLASDAPCLVMEYLDGKPLSALLSGKQLSKQMLLSVISEVLSGLHHAHELRNFDGTPLNIVHRDVSPHNVFVTYDGAAKILDFGIARMATAVSETATGEVKGKLTYMAPEQLLGEELDRRADIFAVGSMLWEAAVGKRMWENVSEATLMHRLASGDIPRPGEHGPIDATLETIIVKATAPNRAERYRTVVDLQRALDDFLASSGGRIATRDVGVALGESFKEEREANAAVIRRSLQQSMPPPSAEVDLEVQAPKSRNGRWFVVLLVLAAALAAGTAISKWGVSKPGPAAAERTPPPSSVAIVVRARPPSAIIEVDGKTVGNRTATVRVLPDAGEHTIRISAPGHASETRVVSFDRDRELDISLRELESEAEAPSARAQPSASTPSNRASRSAVSGTRPLA
ncbi:MAG TPA: serine/threonine-protein kinase, partial [Polyangiaceae bacterium]